ncbi:jg12325 [Pararge aegeria aegeria]|uniref:Jg12325 protein n=1 Tax=Pararge aegeria aegeria TaxID=348720 RepID=A0A8S4R7Q7_9NEOP|nr:jg12325 [Pararge aegeria aegeria]
MKGIGKEVPQPEEVSSTPCEILLALYRVSLRKVSFCPIEHTKLFGSQFNYTFQVSVKSDTEHPIAIGSSEESILELSCWGESSLLEHVQPPCLFLLHCSNAVFLSEWRACRHYYAHFSLTSTPQINKTKDVQEVAACPEKCCSV